MPLLFAGCVPLTCNKRASPSQVSVRNPNRAKLSDKGVENVALCKRGLRSDDLNNCTRLMTRNDIALQHMKIFQSFIALEQMIIYMMDTHLPESKTATSDTVTKSFPHHRFKQSTSLHATQSCPKALSTRQRHTRHLHEHAHTNLSLLPILQDSSAECCCWLFVPVRRTPIPTSYLRIFYPLLL